MYNRFNKMFVGLFAAAALFVGGATAHAATLTSSQVQAIVSLLQSFNVDQATIASVYQTLVGGTVPNPVPTPVPGCMSFTQNMGIGMHDSVSGGEIARLQAVLGVQTTGYFGVLTRQAVANFQAAHGISPVGAVGPLTRAALNQLGCGGGTVPLSSTFSLGAPFMVGLGQTATESQLGQLTVKLLSVSGATAQVTLGLNCPRGTQCFYYPTQTLSLTQGQQVTFQGYTITLTSLSASSATFLVLGSQSNQASLTATPSIGPAPLTVGFGGSLGTSCSGNYELDYGDGQWDVLQGACSGSFTRTHVYMSAGTYTASLSPYIACLHSNPRCMVAQPAPLASVTVTVTGSSQTSAPAISSVVPAQGAVGTQVTITGSGFTADNTVHFGIGGTQHVPSTNNGTIITYTIPSQVGPCNLVASGQICAMLLQQVTPGSYGLSVSNENGQSLSTSFTVTSSQTVGGLTVSQPTAGQVFTRGQDMSISWSYPVTPGSVSMVMDLYTAAGTKVGTIANSSNAIGSYVWHIPGYPQNYMCTMQYPNGLCGVSIPTGQYYIKVSAVSDPFSSVAVLYASAQSGVFTINQQ